MITNNQSQVTGLLVNMLSQAIYQSSNRNQVRAAFAQQAQQNNWLSPIMDDMTRLGLLIYQSLAAGAFGALPANITDEQVVNSIVNTDFQIVDLYYAAWCLQQKVPLGPQEQQQAVQYNQKFMDIARTVGFFNQQPQQPAAPMGNAYGVSHTNLASPGLSFGNNNGGYGPGNTTPTGPTPTTTMGASNISSKVTMVGGDPDPVETPETTTAPTITPSASVSAYKAPQSPIGDLGAPSVSDRRAWLQYHATRLCDRDLVGPDYTSTRPYDMLLTEEQHLWIPAHLSPYEMDPGTKGPFPSTYSPAHAVRFIVFTPEGDAYEDYLQMKDHPEMRYLALEQGASPRDLPRRGVSDLGKVLTRINTPPTDIPVGDVVDTNNTPATTLSSALEEITIMLADNKAPALLVSSREEGELQSSVHSPESTGSSCYIECTPYFINEAEAAFVSDLEEAGSLNELSAVFAKYGEPSTELRRIHGIMNRRLTKHFLPIFEFEFGLVFDDFANDIGDLLNAVLMDHDNATLTRFVKAARPEVPVALGTLCKDRVGIYIHEALGIPLEDIPAGTTPLVLSTQRVVVNVPQYLDLFGFNVSDRPTVLDPEALGLSEEARTVVRALIGTLDAVATDWGDCMTYVRTLDDARLELHRSLMHPEVVTIRKLV